MNPADVQKYILIKKDVNELRQLILGNNNIHEWNKIVILYTIFLVYQHVFAAHTKMKEVLRYQEFDFKRDFKDVYMFFFFICNLRVAYLYMIKSILRVDRKLAGSLHSYMGEYFDY